jgi:hypothetical protein
MPVSILELNEFLNNPNYAHFMQTNLHMHTPSTSWDWDSRDNQTRKAATITPEDYFNALNKTSLELVAITDHNCISWCNILIKFAQKARNEGLSRLHILPGVEITTYEGPHLLAIFDENQDIDEIKKMLIRLGMSGEGKKEDRVGILSPDGEIAIPKILEEIEKLHGIAIAPHVHQKDGLWGSKDFRGRIDVLNNKHLRILAAPSGDIKRVAEQSSRVRLLYKNMDSTLITNSFGFINVSDCHRIEDFELNTTWIKMTTPSLDGIKQIIYEPELRIAHKVEIIPEQVEHNETILFERPSNITHPYIAAMSISGGMLDGQKVIFSPNQNCIIGKNYAGKSALLDCLRFVMNGVPVDIDTQDKFADRMRYFIGEGGEVRAYIFDQSANIYGVSRTLSCTQIGRGSSAKWQIEGTPNIYSLWNNEFKRESDLSLNDILHLEVYPQGEVVKIKDNALRQMNIVDVLAKIEYHIQDLTIEESNGDKTILGKLNVNSQRIIDCYERQYKLSKEISGTDQLQKEIDDLDMLTKSPLFSQKKKWAETEVIIDGYKKDLIQLSTFWSSTDLQPNNSSKNSDIINNKINSQEDKPTIINTELASSEEFSSHALTIYSNANKLIEQNLASARSAFSEADIIFSELLTNAKSRMIIVDEEIRVNMKEGTNGIDESGLIDRITEKRRRLTELQQKQQELTKTKTELDNIIVEREELLSKYYAEWEIIRAARRKMVNFIDSKSASNIKAELIENTERESYKSLLLSISDGLTNTTNRIQNKEAQIDSIITNITPKQLIDIIKEGNTDRLLRMSPDLTSNTARILLSMGQKDIHKLEQCVLGDKFVISYKKDGETNYTPIDSGLSGGEQALALISVAMIPKQVPLVIDQPEDELGPALITHELVEQIRNVKSERQMIFVTHVPNIPVLADSEQVIYIQQVFANDKKTSIIKCSGSLDQQDIIVHLLELDGGDIAFQKRNERYLAVMRTSN